MYRFTDEDKEVLGAAIESGDLSLEFLKLMGTVCEQVENTVEKIALMKQEKSHYYLASFYIDPYDITAYLEDRHDSGGFEVPISFEELLDISLVEKKIEEEKQRIEEAKLKYQKSLAEKVEKEERKKLRELYKKYGMPKDMVEALE